LGVGVVCQTADERHDGPGTMGLIWAPKRVPAHG
jgi:hypothetical protein